MTIRTRKRRLLQAGAAGLALSIIVGTGGMFSNMKKVTVNVVVFSYLGYPIYDVYLGKKMVGGSAALSDSPYGQFSTVAGVDIPLGPQELTWRSSTSGTTFSAKNKITLTESDIPDDVRVLGIHIYPDNTYELSFSNSVLEQSTRGQTYAKPYQKKEK